MTPTVQRPNLDGLDRQQRVEALRAYKNEVVLARRRVAPPGWLNTRRRRRALTATAALPLVLAAVAAVLEPARLASYLLIAAFVVFMLVWFGLRSATALLADLPDGAVDERELAERGHVFRYAYLTVGGLLALVLLASLADELSDGRLLDEGGYNTLLIGALITSILVPSAIAAWRLPDAVPDDEADDEA